MGGRMSLMNKAGAQSQLNSDLQLQQQQQQQQQQDSKKSAVTTITGKIAPAKPILFISATDFTGCNLTLGYQLFVDCRTLHCNPSLSPLYKWLKTHAD